MKLKQELIVLAAAAVLAGCDQNRPSSSETKPDTTAQDVKKETSEALNTTKDYVVENKDQFIASANQKLQALDAEISRLSERAADLKDDAKTEADKTVAALKEKRGVASQKLDELKQSGKETWNGIKAGFEKAMTELENAYEQTKSKFKPDPSS